MVEVYLLHGPDLGLKADFIGQVLEKTYAGEELDHRRFFAGSDTVGDMVAFLRTPSLFGQLPVAEWNDLAALKGAELKQLAQYCKKPEGEGSLFLCNSAFKADKTLAAHVPASRQKIFWEMFENRKVPWLKQYFRQYGYQIDVQACEHLLTLVDNATDELRASCELVMLYADQQRQLDKALVEAALIHSKRESVFTLFDQLASGTLERVLEIAQILESRGEHPGALILGLQRQFAKLVDIKSQMSHLHSVEQACKAEGIVGKNAQKSYAAACRRYGSARLKDLNHLLWSYDLQCRQQHGRISSIKLRHFLYHCFAGDLVGSV